MNVDSKLLKEQIRLIEKRALPKDPNVWDGSDEMVDGLIDFLWLIQSRKSREK